MSKKTKEVFNLEVFREVSIAVVNWKNEMDNTIKLLEDTGNYNFRLDFIKKKVKELGDELEKELSKLELE